MFQRFANHSVFRLGSSCLMMLVAFSGNAQSSKRVNTTPSTTEKASMESKVGAEPQIRLIKPGAKPRRPLRLTASVGDQMKVAIVVDVKQELTAAGNAIPSPALPAQQMTLQATVDDVSAQGDITWSYEYVDAKVVGGPKQPSPLAGQIETMVKSVVGSTGRQVLSDRGIQKENDFDDSPGANPLVKSVLEGMKDALNQVITPLPQQPVGVGAVWQVDQAVTSGGIQVDQKTYYRLDKVTEGGFQVSVKRKQSAKEQSINAPGALAGATAKVKSLQATGEGANDHGDGKFLPTRAILKSSVESQMEVAVAGQTQEMSTKLTTKVQLRQL